MKPPAGVCRFCHCTAENPCKLSNGDECSFVTKLANRCNRPECVRAWEREMDAEIEADRERRKRLGEMKRQMKRTSRIKKFRRAA